MPWERDELWAPFISTRLSWRRRRGARREMGLSLSRAWPGTGIPCERCLRPGHQGPKNPGPGPAPLTPGGTGPRTSPFRPQNPGSVPPTHPDPSQGSQGDFGEESMYRAESRELGTRAGEQPSRSARGLQWENRAVSGKPAPPGHPRPGLPHTQLSVALTSDLLPLSLGRPNPQASSEPRSLSSGGRSGRDRLEDGLWARPERLCRGQATGRLGIRARPESRARSPSGEVQGARKPGDPLPGWPYMAQRSGPSSGGRKRPRWHEGLCRGQARGGGRNGGAALRPGTATPR